MAKKYGYGKEADVRRRVKKVALAGVALDSIAFTWQNPEDKEIIIDRVILDITTAGDATSVMDVGIVADATATANNLLQGVPISAIAVKDNINDGGTNGKAKGKMDKAGGSNDYITGKVLTAGAPNLAGYVYIFYLTLD